MNVVPWGQVYKLMRQLKAINFLYRIFSELWTEMRAIGHRFTLSIIKCYMSYFERICFFLKVGIHILEGSTCKLRISFSLDNGVIMMIAAKRDSSLKLDLNKCGGIH
jgi:hypothetical protein